MKSNIFLEASKEEGYDYLDFMNEWLADLITEVYIGSTVEFEDGTVELPLLHYLVEDVFIHISEDARATAASICITRQQMSNQSNIDTEYLTAMGERSVSLFRMSEEELLAELGDYERLFDPDEFYVMIEQKILSMGLLVGYLTEDGLKYHNTPTKDVMTWN